MIPTEVKAEYLAQLVVAGLPAHRCGELCFAEARAADGRQRSRDGRSSTHALPAGSEPPEIIGIVVNEKGLERALATPGVTTIGYPYSISAYFRRANANMSAPNPARSWKN